MKQKNVQKKGECGLLKAVLQLKTVKECERFFYDLCTPAEMEECSDRWRVARMLVKEVPYRQISEKISVSTTTVGRMARFLIHGNHGYKTVLERLGQL